MKTDLLSDVIFMSLNLIAASVVRVTTSSLILKRPKYANVKIALKREFSNSFCVMTGKTLHISRKIEIVIGALLSTDGRALRQPSIILRTKKTSLILYQPFIL